MKTSLQKSHDKGSNAKLTLISILLAFSLLLIWLSIALVIKGFSYSYIILGIFTAIFIISLIFLQKFTR